MAHFEKLSFWSGGKLWRFDQVSKKNIEQIRKRYHPIPLVFLDIFFSLISFAFVFLLFVVVVVVVILIKNIYSDTHSTMRTGE